MYGAATDAKLKSFPFCNTSTAICRHKYECRQMNFSDAKHDRAKNNELLFFFAHLMKMNGSPNIQTKCWMYYDQWLTELDEHQCCRPDEPWPKSSKNVIHFTAGHTLYYTAQQLICRGDDDDQSTTPFGQCSWSWWNHTKWHFFTFHTHAQWKKSMKSHCLMRTSHCTLFFYYNI